MCNDNMHSAGVTRTARCLVGVYAMRGNGLPHSGVHDASVTATCAYSKAFKQRFGMTPSGWRREVMP